LFSITYQLKLMSHEEAHARLGGITALAKSQCTSTYEYCAREASQIFGGAAYTKGRKSPTLQKHL
jgi:alkylation response protein AidB-like acyl-CoA dehydrogenase